MESSLHRQLKARYGPERGGLEEVVVAGFRIDAVGPDGELIEVQTGALGPLRGKLRRLLAGHRVRVVKPIVARRRIVRAGRSGESSGRLSPKRGEWIDAFDDLIGLARVFPHPNLRIDLLAVEIDEVRSSRRRRPGYVVEDRVLRGVVGSVTLGSAGSLWSLLPGRMPGRFTTRDLAERLGRPLDFAQRVAYCLRESGAADVLGKSGHSRVYAPRGGESLTTDEHKETLINSSF